MDSKNKCICCDDICDNLVFLHKTRRHKHILCESCAVNYLGPKIKQITTNIKNNFDKELTIPCPGTYHGLLRNKCTAKIHIKDININSKFPLYTDIFRIKYLLDNPEYSICPNNNCGNIVHSDNYDNNLTCNICNTNWCKRCGTIPFHTNMNCFEYEVLSKNTDNSKYITTLHDKGLLKFCPVCVSPTIKEKDILGNDIGCNKIICIYCSTKWCWLCSKSNIDYDHFNPNNNNSCVGKLWLGTKI